MYYVYLMDDATESTIGCTNDLASLLQNSSRPHYFKFTNRDTARNFETYLRSESGRIFIQSHGFLDLYFLAHALQYAYEKTTVKTIVRI